jgi:hypothetical protein
MTGYPWSDGQTLFANDLDAAFASAQAATAAAQDAANTAKTIANTAQTAATAAQAAATAAAAAGIALNVLTVGAKGDGATDDAQAIQGALNAMAAKGGGIVYCPPTGSPYLLHTGLVVPGGVRLLGSGTRNLQGGSLNIAAWCAVGTWFQCTDITNSAVALGTTTVPSHGAAVSGINFIYSQPTPGVTWTPTDYPFAVLIQSDHVTIEDIMVIGATRGINIQAPNSFGIGAGIALRNIFLSVYLRGLRTFGVNDTITIDGLWVNDQTFAAGLSNPVAANYLINNLVGWEVDYCDNPLVNNMYLFLCRYGMLLTDETFLGNTHSLYNACISNLQTVLCRTAISVATPTTTATGSVTNWNAQSYTGATDTLFNLPSDNVDFSIANLTVPSAGGKIFELGGGTRGKLNIDGLNVSGYSASTAGQPALQVNAGATLVLGNRTITKSGGNGQVIAGAGSGGIVSGENLLWHVLPTALASNVTANGAAQSVCLENDFNPVATGKYQARISGSLQVVTPQGSGTASVKLQNFPEIIASGINCTSATSVIFDSNWIDISSATNVTGTVQVTATSGVIYNFSALTVQFR